MIMLLCRHAGECQHPVSNCFDWIPAFAGMTIFELTVIIQIFVDFEIGSRKQM
jgi:hypothetical protein